MAAAPDLELNGTNTLLARARATRTVQPPTAASGLSLAQAAAQSTRNWSGKSALKARGERWGGSSLMVSRDAQGNVSANELAGGTGCDVIVDEACVECGWC